MDATPGPKRRWNPLRISLRALIVLVLAAGVWLGWVVREARVQRQAVAAIQGAGGLVFYDFQYQDGQLTDQGTPGRWAPAWLVEALGLDYFGTVVAVHLIGLPGDLRPPSDADLAHLGRLRGLVELKLFSQEMTDERWVYLEGLIHLKSLDLMDTQVSDAGMVHLGRLKRLEVLHLAGSSEVSDAGVAPLKGMRNLRDLDLRFTGVSDAGVADLRRALPGLVITR